MPLSYPSIPAALRERARRQPDAPVYTFIDYEFDSAGDVETLSWSQVHRRPEVVAAPGSIPSTSSGKVRRSTCAESYEFIPSGHAWMTCSDAAEADLPAGGEQAVVSVWLDPRGVSQNVSN